VPEVVKCFVPVTWPVGESIVKSASMVVIVPSSNPFTKPLPEGGPIVAVPLSVYVPGYGPTATPEV
jgi:hypothetical protein